MRFHSSHPPTHLCYSTNGRNRGKELKNFMCMSPISFSRSWKVTITIIIITFIFTDGEVECQRVWVIYPADYTAKRPDQEEAQFWQAPEPKILQPRLMALDDLILPLPTFWHHWPGAFNTQQCFLLLTLKCSPDENIQSTLVTSFSSVLWKIHPNRAESPTWTVSSTEETIKSFRPKE